MLNTKNTKINEFKHLEFIHDQTQKILIKNNGCARIMTYNLHGFYDAKSKNKYDEIMNTIRSINPDVIVFEELFLYGQKNINLNVFTNNLKDMEFKYNRISKNKINAVFSKYPFNSKEIELRKDPIRRIPRNAIVCEFLDIMPKLSNDELSNDELSNDELSNDELSNDESNNDESNNDESNNDESNNDELNNDESNNDKSMIMQKLANMILVGTHLDVFDESGVTRSKQMQMIIDEINNDNNKIKRKIIITGDFNSLRKADYTLNEWNHLTNNDKQRNVITIEDAIPVIEKNGFIDCFTQCGLSLKTSVWSNRRVDYIFGKNVQFEQCSEYKVTYSDHYPIYADI